MRMMWFQIWEENMDYKVVVTAEAEEDLNQFIQYLILAKKNKQAAKNVLDDVVYVDDIFHELQDYENRMI